MQPSEKYASTEKTYAGGFVYKETNTNFSALYGLDDELDMSVSYTTPINSNLNNVTMGGWNNNSASAYVTKNLQFSKNWLIPAGTRSYCNVNGLTVSKDSFSSIANVSVVFGKGQQTYYYFGKSAQASATVGSFGNKLITDFDVSHIAFRANITGWTKTDFEYFIANGTLQDSDGYSIDFDDFMTNPSTYYIRTFDPYAYAYWDGSTWKGNNLSQTPNIHLYFLINSDKVSGICNFDKHHFNAASGTNNFGVEYKLVSNNSSSNATNITALVRGSVASELSSTCGFILDKAVSPLKFDLDISLDALQNMCDGGATGSYDTLPAHEVEFCPAVRVLRYDKWTMSYDVGSSGTTHPTDYRMYFCMGMKGEYVYKLLAYAGVYFYTKNLQDLIDSGATPTNMKVTGMRLGEMNSAGQTTGNWINPNQMDDYQGINKAGSIIHPSYNPQPPTPSGTDEDNTDPIPTVGAPYASGLSRYYVTTAASPILAHISEAMGAWNLKDSGKDLYKNIISCKLIKSPAPIPVSGSEPFTVYGVTLQYEGSDITLPVVNDNPTASFGSYNIPRKFYDFRDYAPYTRCEIYLPYCGWTALPSHVVGRSVSVTYYTDIIAGTCKAVVYCNSNVVAQAAGVIGLDIPMVTENAGAKAEAVTMGLIAYGKAGLQTALGVGAAVATKGKAGVKTALSGLENVVSAYSQTAMAFNQNYTEINGKNGDGCCIAGISAIVIKIIRPKYGSNTTAPYVPAEYPHAVGYVSMKSMKVGSVTGLLIGGNVDVSGISGATDREKEIIKRTIENGIIVNAAPSP